MRLEEGVGVWICPPQFIAEKALDPTQTERLRGIAQKLLANHQFRIILNGSQKASHHFACIRNYFGLCDGAIGRI